MNLWSSRPTAEGGRPAVDIADTGVPDGGAEAGSQNEMQQADPARPTLQRNQQPQAPAPDAIPSGNTGPQQPPDSLSLAQLRRIVAEFPRTEPIAYDYVYADVAPIEEEIDEWFVYNFWQWVRLNTAQRNFYAEWAELVDDGRSWKEVDDETRNTFVTKMLESMSSPDPAVRSVSIGSLTYIILGRWTESIDEPNLPNLKDSKAKTAATASQLGAMKGGVELIADCCGIPLIWEALRRSFESFWYDMKLLLYS
jgi:hypothetical protein